MVAGVAKFSELVDGIVKLGGLAAVVYLIVRLTPTMRERGFTAKIFGNEVTLNGATHAVETLSANFEKQIDDLRQIVESSEGTASRSLGEAAGPLAGPGIRR